MKKEQKVLNYYVICNRLKDVIRTGWKDWNVKRERIESVAEHIYSVQMLAIHELGETVIGDLTQFQISRDEKEKIEHQAVHKILSELIDGKQIEELFLEFDAHESKEAQFAYQCDKLECDLQCKLYDEQNCVDLHNQSNNDTIHDKQVQKLLENGATWSEMWLKFGQAKYPYDENFMTVSKYAMQHSLLKSKEK